MNGNNNQKQGLVPRLRFPEFSDAGEWTYVPLGQIAYLLNEKTSNRKFRLLSITAGIGLVSQIEKFGREIAGAQYKNYYVIKRDDFAYNKSSTKDCPEGFIARYLGEQEGAVPNSIFTCFRVHLDASYPPFLSYLFANNLHGKWLRRFITVGARAHGSLNVDDKDLLATPIPVPPAATLLVEQQKIADCLTSLDDLITAQSQKINALKTHKKGLMQQLFPHEGETLPRLRFPEFRDAGEWERKKIGQIADFYKGKGISKADIAISGNQPCIRYGEIYTIYGEVISDVVSRTNIPASVLFLSKKNDVIIPASGETKIDIAAASCVTQDDVALGGDLNVIRSQQNGIFLSYFLNGVLRNKIARIAQGDTVVHLYSTQLELVDIAIPSRDEQQKIADCLTSLDDLITAQSQKIDALKTHKKGLMQQLFPILDEVDA